MINRIWLHDMFIKIEILCKIQNIYRNTLFLSSTAKHFAPY